MPDSVNQLFAEANRAQTVGRPEEAPSLLLEGIARSKNGDFEEAIALLEQVTRIDRSCAPAHLWLSASLRSLGRFEEALPSASLAVELVPTSGAARYQLGLCQIDAGEFQGAEENLRVAISQSPEAAPMHYALGLALRAQNRNQDAIKAFRRSALFAPDVLATHVALRDAYFAESNFADAVAPATTVANLQPDSAEANLWLVRALVESHRGPEADTYLDRALQLDCETALCQSLLGRIYQIRGDFATADNHIRRSVNLEPKQGAAYLALVTNRKLNSEDREIVDQMEWVASEGDLAPLEQCLLEYALGKGLEDLGEYSSAMAHFDSANRLDLEQKFGNQQYDRREGQTQTGLTIETFNTDFLVRNRELGDPSETPIFVVGMIRSGTTLAEQILSSHAEIGSAGEQPFWLDKVPALLSAGNIDPTMAKKFARKYLAILTAAAPGKARIVDKMPSNYGVLGLIHSVFPNAKIIHVQRDPADTCLSIYTTPNGARLDWAGDKANIVFNYRLYERQMDHWRRTLPAGSFMDVRYEEMVLNLETVAREMISFCGLPWDDACLRPERNQSAVLTPSVAQVRRPVYKTSIARWKKYEDVLGPFESLVDARVKSSPFLI